jgi:hypothetical protein
MKALIIAILTFIFGMPLIGYVITSFGEWLLNKIREYLK